MDLTNWDSSSGESDGIVEPTFVHDQGSRQPSGLSSESAYTIVSAGLNADPLSDASEPMDVDEHGV